jgi:hypothetical protein
MTPSEIFERFVELCQKKFSEEKSIQNEPWVQRDNMPGSYKNVLPPCWLQWRGQKRAGLGGGVVVVGGGDDTENNDTQQKWLVHSALVNDTQHERHYRNDTKHKWHSA